MDYEKLMSISGVSGLYEMQVQKGDGVIVLSIKDKTSKFISSRQHRVTLLKDIEIYTTDENVMLIDVFKAVRESAEAQPETSNKEAVIAYFKKVYPAMDFERVYYSDMKKVLLWFNELKEGGFDFEVKEEKLEEKLPKEKEDNIKGEEKAEKEEKPKAKKSAKKEEPKKEEKPKAVKKAATKKAETEKPKTEKKTTKTAKKK